MRAGGAQVSLMSIRTIYVGNEETMLVIDVPTADKRLPRTVPADAAPITIAREINPTIKPYSKALLPSVSRARGRIMSRNSDILSINYTGSREC